MQYLIDGYNLLYALGEARKRMGPTELERARVRLLERLAGAMGADAGQLTVIFDAAHAPPGVQAEQVYKGIHVQFAIRENQADDRIEDLIRRDSAPQKLAVVSDDHRIQIAARRRHCTVMPCMEFLDVLDRQRQRRPSRPEPSAKPETLSAEETDHWLREFGELADGDDFCI